jgi:uncharacterized phiE125 gp8 family phage protein
MPRIFELIMPRFSPADAIRQQARNANATRSLTMIPILLTPPTTEPVTLAEAKAFLRVDTPDEDQMILSFLAAARLMVEAHAGRVLISQTWRLVLDRWPVDGTLRLPLSPLISISAARVYDANGIAQAVSVGALLAQVASDPANIQIVLPVPQPGRVSGGIEIDVVVGYGASAAQVPESLKQAVLRLAARWFEHRGDLSFGQTPVPPADVLALVAPHRRARL